MNAWDFFISCIPHYIPHLTVMFANTITSIFGNNLEFNQFYYDNRVGLKYAQMIQLVMYLTY